MKAEVVGEKVSLWGEGPTWHSGILYYVDIEGHLVRTFCPYSGEEEEWNVGERVGMVVPREGKDGLVIAGDEGISYFYPKNGEKELIADPEPEKRGDNRFNDGKCDPVGRLWAGTISTVKKEGDANLYRLNAEGELSLIYPSVTNSNGICWNGSGDTMYYIDTPSKEIKSFEYDQSSGEICNEKVAFSTEQWDGSPDGMTIDSNGNVWVAFCRGSVVRCVDPGSGSVQEEIEVPVSGVTSCVFGDADLETLYITSGQFANLEEPGAGRLYCVRPGVSGSLSVAFAG